MSGCFFLKHSVVISAVDLLQSNGSISTAVSTSAGGSETATSSANPASSTSHHAADSGGGPATEVKHHNGDRPPETYLLKAVMTPLYSINPLCIPVKYLGLQQQQQTCPPTSDTC